MTGSNIVNKLSYNHTP